MAHWPYNTPQWVRLRKAKLAQQPLCETLSMPPRACMVRYVDLSPKR
jgi:hypothetical protein